MALLLALCGEKHELSVKEVPLSASAHEAVTAAFASQEVTFRDGEERPFDQNWLNEGDEIATTSIPASVEVFDQIKLSTDTTLGPVDRGDVEEIRGLAIVPEDGGMERILVQLFAATQSLSRPWLVSLFFDQGTYTRLEAPGFRLGDKLVCIVEDGAIKFRSLHNLGHVIDTSAIFSAATDREVTVFADRYSNLFEVSDVNGFVYGANRNARKYMASLASSGVLQNHTVVTLEEASRRTGLRIEVRNGKIVMPSRGGEITELMRFLNDGRYVGPISGKAFITNSRRLAT